MHVVACLMDLAFVIDHSGSITDHQPAGVDNWGFVLNFMISAVQRFNVGPDRTHVGAVSFGTQFTLLFS